jgi:hypothetical protein
MSCHIPCPVSSVSLMVDIFSAFLCSSWPWHFGNVQVLYFVRCLCPIRVRPMSPCDWTQAMHFWDIRRAMRAHDMPRCPFVPLLMLFCWSLATVLSTRFFCCSTTSPPLYLAFCGEVLEDYVSIKFFLFLFAHCWTIPLCSQHNLRQKMQKRENTQFF